MKTGLLFGVAVIVLAGTVVGGVADVWAACVPTKDCTTLGYKYTTSQCAGKGLACPFDTSKWTCTNPADIPTKGYCCNNIEPSSSYYKNCQKTGQPDCNQMEQACLNTGGTPKYTLQGATGTLENGDIFKNDYMICLCSYINTKESCAAECKGAPTGKSCVNSDDKKTYYESCGASTCSSGQICSSGTCKTVATSGYCCGHFECGFDAKSHPRDSDCLYFWGISCYQHCITYGYPDCDDMYASCSRYGRPKFDTCLTSADYKFIYSNAHIECQ